MTVVLYLGESEEGRESVFPGRADWSDTDQAWSDGEYSACAR